jgi:hypothetical protein
MDMSAREAISPRKTRMAEMKKVLSPISERMIVIKERMRVSAEKSADGSVDILHGVKLR